MKKKDLLESFTNVLSERIVNKKELVYQIADILHIEKESAYRRLSGKVHFTVREIGILATEMDISIDSLLNQYSDKTSVSFKMDFISKSRFPDCLETLLSEFYLSHQQTKVENAEAGCVVSSLPIEFFYSYPHLCKFMYF